MRGYHRRRGWLAWHVAALGRVESLPDLADLTGEVRPEPDEAEQAEEMLRITRGWQSLGRSLPVVPG